MSILAQNWWALVLRGVAARGIAFAMRQARWLLTLPGALAMALGFIMFARPTAARPGIAWALALYAVAAAVAVVILGFRPRSSWKDHEGEIGNRPGGRGASAPRRCADDSREAGPETRQAEGQPSDAISRRAMLATTARLAVATAVGAIAMPSAMATMPAAAGLDAFMALSMRLTGRERLDAAVGARLHEALGAEIPRFQADVEELLALVDGRMIDPLRLQSTLDAKHPALAALPRRIVSAWYTGIVGEGERARCIAFETSLMNGIVADHLSPPSYCYGPPGSWSGKPA